MIKFNPIVSSNINGVHFDTESNTLHIQFKNKTVYTYHNVKEAVYKRLLDSKSKSKFLTDNIHDKHLLKKKLHK